MFFIYGTIKKKERGNFMSITSDRIKKERTSKGLNKKDLAFKMGLKSQSTITNWENGLVMPKPDKLQKLAEILDVSPLYLYGFIDTKREDYEVSDSEKHFDSRREKLIQENLIEKELFNDYISEITSLLSKYDKNNFSKENITALSCSLQILQTIEVFQNGNELQIKLATNVLNSISSLLNTFNDDFFDLHNILNN